jgi:transcriptional regulator of heat shock response
LQLLSRTDVQSKQDQIQELLSRIDQKDGEIARVSEEKEQELLIMQEGMDTTLKELSDLRLVSTFLRSLRGRAQLRH